MSSGGVPTPRVLVVDDDVDQRWLVRRLFGATGIVEVAEAADGAEALAVAPAFAPDLIVLDLVMPGGSGTDICPALQEAAPDARIVVLSNLPRHRLLAAVQRAGAVGYVEKRTPPDRLVSELMLAASLVEAIRASADFPRDVSSSRSARQFVRQTLGDGDEELLATAELLVSELVTNAVMHGQSPPRVAIDVRPTFVRVEVSDDDPTPPRPRVPTGDQPGGHGLLLTERVSSRWGSTRTATGKVVWFELDRP
jgi:CheY-like chemotaxis protein